MGTGQTAGIFQLRILLVLQDYRPALNSAANLYGSLADELMRRSHEVGVLTRSVGRYTSTQRTEFEGSRRSTSESEWRVATLRVPQRILAARTMEQAIMGVQFLTKGLFRVPRHDAIIVYSPPLPICIAAIALGKRWNVPVITNVQDLYPQTAIDLGLLRNRVVKKIVSWMERWVYRHSRAVVAHSEGNKGHVINVDGRADRVHVIENWADTDLITPANGSSRFREEHGLKGDFIVSFGGTMGFAQGLQDVIALAELVQDREHIKFVLAGDGVLRESLEESVLKKHLSNVKFVGHLPEDQYADLLRESNLTLVTLDRRLGTPVIPGKIHSAMAAGTPILLYCNKGSDAVGLLNSVGLGIHVEAGRIDRLESALIEMYENAEAFKSAGIKAREYAVRHNSPRVAADRYEALISKLVENNS